jgi:hypothetical protein
MSLLAGKRLLIVAGDRPDGGRETLGLGDLMRVLTLVPNFNATRVVWCSPDEIFPLVADCPFIDAHRPLSAFDGLTTEADHVLNLTHRDLTTDLPITEVRGILAHAGEGSFKKKVYDLPGNLASALGCVGKGNVTVARTTSPPRFDVGLNFRVPAAWRIKEMPIDHWQEVARLLPKEVSVAWQPEETNLADYFDWVKDCRLLLSSVGFGCHIAMFYGRKLVMLAGPTDFAEVHSYKDGVVLYPPSTCVHRPCYLPTGVSNCGCMPDFRPQAIAATVVSQLESA